MPLTADFAVHQRLDDFLTIQYSILGNHFHPSSGSEMLWALAKPMSFSYFLAAIRALGIPYNIALSLLWVLSAIVAVLGLKKLYSQLFPAEKITTLKKILWMVVYIFLLFCPSGFDEATGSRIYRETILPPTVLMLIGLMTYFVALFMQNQEIRFLPTICSQCIIGIILGFVWSFFWFIKESSIWLLPAFGSTLIVCVVLQAKRIIGILHSQKYGMRTKKIIAVALGFSAMVPIGVVAGVSSAYDAINTHYYGVPYASVRTEGEIAGFFKRLYQIDDSNRSQGIWVPWSTMEKAIHASPTLRNNVELINQLTTNAAFLPSRDWRKTPPSSDMGVWTMMVALQHAGLYDSPVEAQTFFKSVNKEIDNAHLPQSKGFTPTKLLPKKTISDVPATFRNFLKTAQPALLENKFSTPNEGIICDDSVQSKYAQDCRTLEIVLNNRITKTSDYTDHVRAKQQEFFNRAAHIVFRISAIIAPILIILTVIMLCCTLFIFIRKMVHRQFDSNFSRALANTLIATVGGLSVFALLLAVTWQYPIADGAVIRWSVVKYYTETIVPLIQIIEIVAVITLIKMFHELKNNQSTNIIIVFIRKLLSDNK